MALACAGVLKVIDEQRVALFDNDGAGCIDVLFGSLDAMPDDGTFYMVYNTERIDE